ncbi:MAG: class I SAM-dependent methyltransferase [Pseudomonadota bacterium]
MDFDNPVHREVFFAVHADLPRQGPGERSATLRALRCIDLPRQPQILDVGCGPGAQTVDLALACEDAQLHAVDVQPVMLEDARRRVVAAGVAERVALSRQDMAQMDFAPGQFDLIWSEGAMYIMGVSAALQAWREFLAADGFVAYTDCVWLQDDIPDEIHSWWMANYPQMVDVAGSVARLEEADYRCVEHFVLPPTAWWDPYYTPMSSNLKRLREDYARDQERLAALEICQEEIDMYARFGDLYSYAFFIGQGL